MLVLSKAMTDHEGGTIPELAERITEPVETIEDFIKKQWFHDLAPNIRRGIELRVPSNVVSLFGLAKATRGIKNILPEPRQIFLDLLIPLLLTLSIKIKCMTSILLNRSELNFMMA